jgi:hypothetical protein
MPKQSPVAWMSGILIIPFFDYPPDLLNQYEEQSHSNNDGEKEEYNTNK